VIKEIILYAISALIVNNAFAQTDSKLAAQYFREARAACEKDAGELWGVSLCGPILLVEPGTRKIFANQADPEGILKSQSNLYTGILPQEINVANTSVVWAGIKWTMLIWPLPDGSTVRLKLMLHESFHRIQEELGFPMNAPSNAHLDTAEGRAWMRLEWAALLFALSKQDAERSKAIADALTFRAYRRSLFPESAIEERMLEMNEGLAEYTGVRLSGAAPNELAIAGLRSAQTADSFVRSFAYATGPAYGVLLDQTDRFWRRNLKVDQDLSELLRMGIENNFPDRTGATALAVAQSYDGNNILAEEQERWKIREQQIALLEQKLVQGPVLVLPLQKMNIQFDPGRVFPLRDHGTVYYEARITDEWGVLNAPFGALIDPKWSTVRVPAPRDPLKRPVEGDGFLLDLASGWRLEPSDRAGDYIVKRSENIKQESK
jgi:hypothetical protein